MNIYEHLRADNRCQYQLIIRILETSADAKECSRLMLILCHEMESQMAAKEQTLYAALLADSHAQELVRRVVEHHDRISELMLALSARALSTPKWMTDFGCLAGRLADHAATEERDILPLASSFFSKAKAEQLGASYLRLKLSYSAVWGAAPPKETVCPVRVSASSQ